MLATVVHRDGVAEHVRDDRGPAGPSLDDCLLARLVERVHLLEQVVVHERAFLQATWHLWLPPYSALLAGAPAAGDQLVAGLASTGPALRLTVRVHRVTPTRSATFTTTVRVVHRVHDHTADGRALTTPTAPAGLTTVDVGVLGVTDLTNRGAVTHVHVADLTRRHPQLGVRSFLRDELHAHTRGAGDLGTATGTELNRVDHRADRDVAQRQVVTRLDVSPRAALHLVALLQLVRGDDVALLPVGVVQQRDTGAAVGVVLDVRDLGRNTVLVVTPEVDDPVSALVAATLVPSGDPTAGVTTTTAVERPHQRLLRLRPGELGEVSDRGAPAARGCWLVLADAHVFSVPYAAGPPKISIGLLSAESVTMARLVSLRLPKPCRVRFRLPGRFSVLTLITFTPKIFSTAILISVLLASGRTRNVYLWSSSSPSDFSEITGAIRTSRGSGIATELTALHSLQPHSTTRL